ncbi:MAG TPA: DUF1987 domain-containing protein [Cyclobacteriaceae bacterium]
MDPLHISATNETPEVVLDANLEQFEITGRSLSDNPHDFYQAVLKWLNEYAVTPKMETSFTFKFEYLNTESAKSILDILMVLESISGAKVSWYFNEDDEDMEEIGEELAELVSVPFEYKPI